MVLRFKVKVRQLSFVYLYLVSNVQDIIQSWGLYSVIFHIFNLILSSLFNSVVLQFKVKLR